ncbi:hypothetical protein UFOVP1155_27 [uncultured Caudovirales phage]|uniref:Uncharacterized protein n=1 Tax=uncultured Caudovirales phage TaxID=2100421 RepID=A0A6J5R1I8_9CAUD|nr:hypothetical protein UFOVP1155_27 [uncultured Caudovirales phage]
MTDSISIGAAYRDQKIVGGSVDNTPIGATTKSTGAFTTLNATGATTLDGSVALGNATTDTIGFYGITPVAQRAYSSALHATSGISSSTDFGATQLAVVQEIQKTLYSLGVWATA